MAKVKEAIDSILEAAPADLKEFAQEFIHLAGGPKGFAKMAFDHFKDAPKGGLVRTNTIKTVLESLRATMAKGGEDDMSNLTEDDLKKLAGTLLQEEAK